MGLLNSVRKFVLPRRPSEQEFEKMSLFIWERVKEEEEKSGRIWSQNERWDMYNYYEPLMLKQLGFDCL